MARLEAMEERPHVPWGLADIGLALVLLVVSALVVLVPVSLVIVLLTADVELEENPTALALLLGVNMGLELLLLGVAAALTLGKYNASWADLGWRRPRRGAVWVPVASLAAAYLTLGAYVGVLRATGLEDLLPETPFPELVFQEPLLIVMAGVLALGLAPLVEETFFRGFVFSGLRRYLGGVGAAVASGLLFALLHIQVGTILPFTIIGMVLAWAYSYTGSLWPSIAVHLVFNSVSFGVAVAGGAT